MSFAATFHVGSDTGIRVLPGAHLVDGRAVIVVISEDLTILADCWQDMQRLVLALHDGIAEARQAEDDAEHATSAEDDISAVATMRATDTDPIWAWTPRVMNGTDQHNAAHTGPARTGAGHTGVAQPLPDEVAAAEEELLEAGGLRVRLQRQAREQLRAEEVPLCRATVALRARALLHAESRSDDPRTGLNVSDPTPTPSPVADPAPGTYRALETEQPARTEPTGAGAPARCERAKVATRLRVGAALRDLMTTRSPR